MRRPEDHFGQHCFRNAELPEVSAWLTGVWGGYFGQTNTKLVRSRSETYGGHATRLAVSSLWCWWVNFSVGWMKSSDTWLGYTSEWFLSKRKRWRQRRLLSQSNWDLICRIRRSSIFFFFKVPMNLNSAKRLHQPPFPIIPHRNLDFICVLHLRRIKWTYDDAQMFAQLLRPLWSHLDLDTLDWGGVSGSSFVCQVVSGGCRQEAVPQIKRSTYH